jgi:hypothetical protein
MKKNILNLATLTLIVTASVFTGCKKDDVTAPVVTLTGASSETVSLQGKYTDLGATAEDDKDGKMTSPTVTSDVNYNLTGTYTITYSSTDAAGNTGTATRKITVVNASASLEGTYTGSETDANGPYTYNVSKPFTIKASTTVNNRVIANRLGDFDNNAVYMDIVGTSITIPSQTVANVGTGTTASCNLHSRKTDGTGSVTSTGFTLMYNDSKISPCTGTRAGVMAVFVKK